ncbi:ribosome maturation factor RimP [Geoalkalibacter halelectricus]|uniref:Ribosome maturation factor RimP n=1 Tax=Geoalkalibacter halelectricus TaxID=2847045 RepID=A0ABY5ZQJ1_9BACT|nr:ribosome maturation factor [Geoalkalibacter halelectricus]MDO3376687.1 ribosome maturation factor [Geoalkalibacter halelectricus]UWZ81361.1 ribosome maturation factor [Geoalkalibacter halelectricus]
MNDASVVDQVKELALPVLRDLGFELVDLEFKREGQGWVLRFFIDKPQGLTLDDCAAFSREISLVLDVEDFIHRAYHLEVSSPGLDRPLKSPEDFDRFRGERIKVKTFEKLDPDERNHPRKTFTGELLGLEEGRIRIKQLDKKGGVVAIPLEAVAKANLDPEFEF